MLIKKEEKIVLFNCKKSDLELRDWFLSPFQLFYLKDTNELGITDKSGFPSLLGKVLNVGDKLIEEEFYKDEKAALYQCKRGVVSYFRLTRGSTRRVYLVQGDK